MRGVLLISAALSVGLAGCDQLRDPQLATYKADAERVKTAVSMKMKDPRSVQWGAIWQNGGRICGWVNAKNGFGGYTGFKHFSGIAVDGADPLVSIEGDTLDQVEGEAGWQKDCGQAERLLAAGDPGAPPVTGPRPLDEQVAKGQADLKSTEQWAKPAKGAKPSATE